MKHTAAISALFCVLVGCSYGRMNHHQEPETPSSKGPSDTRIDSKPAPYEDVSIVGRLNRLEYKELSETVLNHRPFKLPDASYDWYAPAIIQVVVTGDRSKAVAMTTFTGGGGGNVITLERKSSQWKVVSVTKWTR